MKVNRIGRGLPQCGEFKQARQKIGFSEVRNWFELAKARRESLRITLGRFNEQKLLTYSDPLPRKSKKV